MQHKIVSRRSILAGAGAGGVVAAMPAWAHRAEKLDVLVLGAGMSGLHAARMLQGAGASVAVLEGSPRIGGRVWTARDVPGQPEFGAEQIGFSYGRVRGNASELGIAMESPAKGAMGETRLPQSCVSLNGAPPIVDWTHAPINKLPKDVRAILPLGLMAHFLLIGDPLHDLQDWLKPEFVAIDRMSMRQYLRSKGATDAALQLIDVSIPAWTLDDANALDFLRKYHYYFWDARHGPYDVVRDGTSTLTDAMAASLKRPVALNKIIAHIDAKAHAVTVTCTDGSRYSARTCINTIPPTVLKDIPISGKLPPRQLAAWRAQRSDQSIQICFNYTEPFWEKDGLPPNMWTDGPFEFFAHTPSRTLKNGMLRSYINGQAVASLNAMSEDELRAHALAELVRLRPAAKGVVSAGHIMNWSTYPFSKGHVAYYQPGDIARYADILGAPVGAMYFAGEHNCRINAGLEGACEAAENAVIPILETLGKS